MTDLETLQSDLSVVQFPVANDLTLIIGLVAGFLISRAFFDLIKFISGLTSDHFKRPNRIKFASLDNDSIEYLYLFKGRYYTSQQFQTLRRQAIERFKEKGI